MKLERGIFRLSDIDREDSSIPLSSNCSKLVLIIHGTSPTETKESPACLLIIVEYQSKTPVYYIFCVFTI